MSAREKIIPVFVPHLGCPNNCVFCNQRRISGSQTPATQKTVRMAVEAALPIIQNVDDAQIAFYGGSFTAIPVSEQIALLEAAKEFIDDGIISSVRLSTRPDAIDVPTLKRLKQYGVRTIEIGAQSLDNEVLRLSGRGHTAEDVENASGLIKQEGFELIIQMMTGLPGDSPEKDIDTAKKIVGLRPNGVRIYPTVIVKDTELYDLWRAGEYKEHTVEDAVSVCAQILPLFERDKITIIRLGLNPTDELSQGAAVGGAYHPALGELVRSRCMRNKAEILFRDLITANQMIERSDVTLGVGYGRISQMIGQHRCNIDYLEAKYKLNSLTVKCVDLEYDWIVLLNLK